MCMSCGCGGPHEAVLCPRRLSLSRDRRGTWTGGRDAAFAPCAQWRPEALMATAQVDQGLQADRGRTTLAVDLEPDRLLAIQR